MPKLYIVRHGQTDSNLRSACIGHKDVALNIAGEEQARKLAEKLADIDFDIVYTSPLSRAVNTIMPTINMKKGIKLVMNYGLIERDFGIMDDMNFEEIKEKFPEEYEKWMSDKIFYRPPGGESVEDVQKRAGETVDKIINAHKESNILIVSHGAIIRTILAHILGLSPEQSRIFYADNAHIAVLDYKDGEWTLEGLNI